MLPKAKTLNFEHLINVSHVVKQLCKFWLMIIEEDAILYILRVVHALKHFAESRKFMLDFTVFQM